MTAQDSIARLDEIRALAAKLHSDECRGGSTHSTDELARYFFRAEEIVLQRERERNYHVPSTPQTFTRVDMARAWSEGYRAAWMDCTAEREHFDTSGWSYREPPKQTANPYREAQDE